MNIIMAAWIKQQGWNNDVSTWPSSDKPKTIRDIPPELIAEVMEYAGRDGIRLVNTGHRYQEIALANNLFKFFCSLDVPTQDDFCTARINEISEQLRAIAWRTLFGMRSRNEVPLTRFIPIPGGTPAGRDSRFSRLPGGRFAIESTHVVVSSDSSNWSLRNWGDVFVYRNNGTLERTLIGARDRELIFRNGIPCHQTVSISAGPENTIVTRDWVSEKTWAANGELESTTEFPQHPTDHRLGGRASTQLTDGTVAYAYSNGAVYLRQVDGTFGSCGWSFPNPILSMIPLDDGNFVIGDNDGTAYLWDHQRHQVTAMPGLNDGNNSWICQQIEPLSNGDLAVVTKRGVRIYNRNGALHREFETPFFERFFKSLPGGRFAVGDRVHSRLEILNANFQTIQVIDQASASDVLPLPGGGLVAVGPELPIGIWGPDVADLVPQIKPTDPKQA